MQVYTVHEPQRLAESLEARADALVFVREGFSPAAFVLGPLWLVAKRLWLPLAGYVAALIALPVVCHLPPGCNAAIGAVLLAGSIGFAFEANTLLRWGLERRGYRMTGTVAGRNFEECEHRFLTGWISRDVGSDARRSTIPAGPSSPSFSST